MTTREFMTSNREQLQGAQWDLIVLPVGSVEQHGTHLPVATDSIIAESVARGVCDRLGEAYRVALGPTVPVGMSQHHLPFGGTVSVSPATYLSMTIDIVTGLWRQGFSRVLLLNGHGGNTAPLATAISTLSDTDESRMVGALSYWNFAEPVEGHVAPGHAGWFETSLMLSIAPDLVDVSAPLEVDEPTDLVTSEANGVDFSRSAAWASSGGVTDGAQAATADHGRALLAGIIERTAHAVEQFMTYPTTQHGGTPWS